MSTLPSGSKIDSTSFTLNVTNTSTQADQTYGIKRTWIELAATWLLYGASQP
jgi:hypothetical protein